MTVAKIQQEVGQLPEAERRKLAVWIMATYPPRSVATLISIAEKEASERRWVPTKPTPDNIPTGEPLKQGLRRFKRLGIFS
jgi:hypothetical protein